jgi:hypothetical protein
MHDHSFGSEPRPWEAGLVLAVGWLVALLVTWS